MPQSHSQRLELKGKVVELKIMRKYFEAIACGEKRIEYRNFNSYYQDMFRPIPATILFRCASLTQFVNVERIEVIDTPQRLLDNKNIKFTKQVFAIHLRK